MRNIYAYFLVDLTAHDHDEIIEYDIDSCDSLWIAKQPNWNLSLDMFERVMEWLENSSELQVPTLDALLTQPFVKNIKFNTIEEIYDHWLEKRLECKQKLLHRVKKESKRKRSKLHKSDDPYIAFRQCPEKMHTRKNRAADHENYIKMLHRKREMLQYMKAAQGLRRTEKKKNQALKMKLAMFEDQYRTRNFLEPLLTPPVEFFDILALSESEESESEAEMCEETSIELEDKETFNFDRRRGCQYYAVMNLVSSFLVFDSFFFSQPISDDSGLGWSDAAEELPQKFHQTSEGPRRKRIGRGGRLLFDRKTSNGAQERCTDYDKFDVNATVKCKRLPTDISLQTSFSLSNSTEIPEECFEIELVIDVDAQFE